MLPKVDTDSAQVRIPPPYMFFASIGAGWTLQVLFPVYVVSFTFSFLVALLLILFGVLGVAATIRSFNASQTHVEPWKPTQRLVTEGIFRFSRNPIYFSSLLLGIGIALLLKSGWNLVTTLLYLYWLRYYVVAREERYLASKFGSQYQAYREKVARWVGLPR